MESLECLSSNSIRLLNKNKLLLPLVRAELINNILKEVYVESDIENQYFEELKKQNGLDDNDKLNTFLNKNKINKSEFREIAVFSPKMKIYCKNNFDHKVESHFLKRKKELDIIIYGLIRVNNLNLASELYFRIKEKEETFENLATKFSEGLEKKSRGIVGPSPIGKLHPHLAEQLIRSEPGHVNTPQKIGDSFVITRLETYDPAQLDDFMREKMNNELFNMYIDSKATEITFNLLEEHISTTQLLEST